MGKYNELFADASHAEEVGSILCSASVSSTADSMNFVSVGTTQLNCDSMRALSTQLNICLPNSDVYTSMDFPYLKITSVNVDSDVMECPVKSSANLLGLSAFVLMPIVAFFN